MAGKNSEKYDGHDGGEKYADGGANFSLAFDVELGDGGGEEIYMIHEGELLGFHI